MFVWTDPKRFLKMYSHGIYETRRQQLSRYRILVQQTEDVFTVLAVRNDRKINSEFTKLTGKYLLWCPIWVSNNQGMIEHCTQ